MAEESTGVGEAEVNIAVTVDVEHLRTAGAGDEQGKRRSPFHPRCWHTEQPIPRSVCGQSLGPWVALNKESSLARHHCANGVLADRSCHHVYRHTVALRVRVTDGSGHL